MSVNVDAPLTKVYYNESCSICRFEINHYKKFEEKIGWIDITNNSSAVNETKKQPKELIRRLHVLKDGQIYKGIDAFLIVWKELPKYKWLHNLVKTPIIYNLSYIAYECLAYLLYLKNKGQLKNERSRN
tara:strand:- start:763 stop:1149 length:387 start_codon:yes stop_codon:yes gene_type:complete